jgi:S1-C subfamily serine protease
MAHEASSPGFNHRQSQILIAALSAIVLAAGVLAGWMLTTRGWLPRGGGENRAPSLLAGGQRSSAQVDLQAGFSAIAKAVIPAVVTVETSARARTEPFPFFFDPFEEFFERLRPYRDGERRQNPQIPQGRGRLLPSGLGSGVLVRADGYILTNNHVVEGADKVEVTLADQRRFTAKIAGVDPPSDVAVLRIDASRLPN